MPVLHTLVPEEMAERLRKFCHRLSLTTKVETRQSEVVREAILNHLDKQEKKLEK